MSDACTSCGACAASAGVTRRRFLTQSTLASVASLLASACGMDLLRATAPQANAGPSGPFTVKLSAFPALATVGGMARVDTGTTAPVALVRTSGTQFAAFSLVCPHRGSTVNVVGSGFTCPNHGARFDAAGTWIGGQRTTNLVALPATYDAAAGTVTVSGVGTTPPRGGGDDDQKLVA